MSETKKGVVALIILAFVFATMGLFIRPLGEGFALFEQSYLRIFLAFCIGTLVFWKDLSWKKLQVLSPRDWVVFTFRAVTLYLGVALFTESILHAKYQNTYFLNNLPLLPLFGYVLLGEKLSLRTLLFIGLGFFGTTLIAITDVSHVELGYGELMAFLAMLSFDLSYVARRWQSEQLNDKESTVLMFAIGAIFLFLVSIGLGESLPTPQKFTSSALSLLVLSGIFNVINLYLTNYGFKRVKVGIAGTIISLEIVFALLYGIFLYRDIPILRELIGGALILFSVYQINRGQEKPSTS